MYTVMQCLGARERLSLSEGLAGSKTERDSTELLYLKAKPVEDASVTPKDSGWSAQCHSAQSFSFIC